MIRNLTTRLILIVFIAALALWIDLNQRIVITNPFTNVLLYERDVSPVLGLDLRGGLQVVMEADLPPDAEIDPAAMRTARDIMENRTNALGVSENLIQVAGERRIVGEFPGLQDTDAVLATIQQTGLLEFVDTGPISLPEGTIIQTDFGLTSGGPTPASGATPTATAAGETPSAATATPEATPEATPTATAQSPTPEPGAAQTPEPEPVIYHTIMTGRDLRDVAVITDQFGISVVKFVLTSDGARIFGDHTSANVGRYLTIALDKKVISSPVIKSEITAGEGVIEGNFTPETANALAVQLRYGSLPVPLKVVETRIIGPTLGEDSLQKSLIAGLVGMIIVILFMAIYYRLPGLVADIAILFYAALAFAVFKYFHFTLTLPGIAGFMLSTGAALDANILIFERLKEELRSGRPLLQAVDQGWTRAWSSIRDSNIATMITSGILFWFGSAFGATIVKGFSVTLFLGVLISLFTAIFVTRTLLVLVLRYFRPANMTLWFGL